MDTDAVTAKFMTSATMTIARAQAEQIRDAVLDLEAFQLGELMTLLRSR
jgi:hypothetical protein